MEEKENKKPKVPIWKKLFLILLVLAILATVAWILLFHVNRFALEIRLAGEPERNLEYGEAYVEPGSQVYLTGTLFWKEGVLLPEVSADISGEVSSEVLGIYTLRYSASFHHWQAENIRTVCVIDTQPPVITLTEDSGETILPGTIYEEPGYQATDNYDGDITARVIRREDMGIITYAVIDSSGNPAYAQREIPYYDPIPPEIHLEGGDNLTVTVGTVFAEPGFTAADNVDGDLTEQVVVEGEVDWLHPGTYPITYAVTDSYQNTVCMTRTVEVIAQPRPETKWPTKKTIYLTFDDGPGPYTTALLDVLDRYGAKATFFVVDSGYYGAMRQIVNRGHSIGIHSVTHDYAAIYASPEAFFQDLYGMQGVIYRETGVKTTLMRFPGGSSNLVSRDNCEGIMTILTEAVQDAGFQYFDWNVDSDDAGRARKPETVRDNVIAGAAQLRTSVVLQHDIHAYSVEAVEEILQWGIENGYTFAALQPESPGVHHGVNN